jgi:hypothetical protein
MYREYLPFYHLLQKKFCLALVIDKIFDEAVVIGVFPSLLIAFEAIKSILKSKTINNF